MSADVVLHIGCEKTGTTSIQQFLRRNRAALARQGLLYPRAPGKVRHIELGLYALPDASMPRSRFWRRGGYSTPEEFRNRLRGDLAREIAASDASTVVLSDEALCRVAPPAIRRLRDLVAGLAGPLRVIVYLRRQDDHLASRYQQAVKVGEVRTLDVWSRQDFSHLYDYTALLAKWQQAYRPASITVRPFERDRFPDGSLTQDFLDAVGADVGTADLRPVPARNESLGVEAVEVLRILNLHRFEREGVPPGHVSNRTHVQLLQREDTGPRLTLPPADLDRFMAGWAESNSGVARDYLGDPAGELFRAPRKTAGTTTEQVLDPARLDHFLELLDIPEEQHAALRQIAEREAAGRD